MSVDGSWSIDPFRLTAAVGVTVVIPRVALNPGCRRVGRRVRPARWRRSWRSCTASTASWRHVHSPLPQRRPATHPTPATQVLHHFYHSQNVTATLTPLGTAPLYECRYALAQVLGCRLRALHVLLGGSGPGALPAPSLFAHSVPSLPTVGLVALPPPHAP